MLPEHRKSSKKLLETGHAVPINASNLEKRKELGLKEIPPTTHSSEKALADVQKIMERTGFKKLIEEKKEEN